jgi:hypothetical protein
MNSPAYWCEQIPDDHVIRDQWDRDKQRPADQEPTSQKKDDPKKSEERDNDKDPVKDEADD